jgi:hypothetical protein
LDATPAHQSFEASRNDPRVLTRVCKVRAQSHSLVSQPLIMGQNRCFGMSLIPPLLPPGSCVRLHSSSRRLPAKPNRREPTIVLLDDTRKSSSKATLLSLEFDGVCNTTPAANQARAEEQSAAYARVIIQPRGSLCYRMTGQLSPETKAKMTIFEVWRAMAG